MITGHRRRLGSRARWRAVIAVPFVAVLMLGARCANPCTDLHEQVCEQLSRADCEVWLANPAISNGMLPGEDYASRRAGVANTTCRLWLHEENFDRYTMPTIRWRIAFARNPSAAGRAPAIAQMAAPGDPLGLPPFLYYAIGPIAMIAIFVWWRIHSKKAATTQTPLKKWTPRD